jgi:hypothetical protein
VETEGQGETVHECSSQRNRWSVPFFHLVFQNYSISAEMKFTLQYLKRYGALQNRFRRARIKSGTVSISPDYLFVQTNTFFLSLYSVLLQTTRLTFWRLLFWKANVQIYQR